MKKLLLGVLTMCCLILPIVLNAQQKKVSGKVTDANGVALPGASVSVNKGKQGTVTNTEGRFEIAAPDDGVVTINFTGYKTQNIKIGANTEVSVTLQEDVAKLDEVIVTGLATTVKRRNLANAVATVSSKELSGTAPAQTFDAALSGKITGANIVANSGAPGGGLSVKLRGVTTIYGNTEPLYVIDGIIVNNRSVSSGVNAVTVAGSSTNPTSTQDNPSSRIADLNPADIENIEVLKGASASAIYGSQAAAGVVVVTTKKGRSGKTKISLNQDLGVISARKLMGMRKLTEKIVEEQAGWDIEDYKEAVAAGKIYDYEKEMYGNDGFTRNTQLSMSGGSDKTTFLFSAATRDEDGIIKRTGYKNDNVRVNVDHRLSDRVKIGLTTSYFRTSSDRGLTNNDNKGVTFGVALSSTPAFEELHPNGQIYPHNNYASSNPLETRDRMKNNELVNRFIGGMNLEATLQQSERSTTRFIARGGVDYYNLKTFAYFPSTLQFESVAGGHNAQGNANNLFTNWSGFFVNTFTTPGNTSFTSTAGITHETGSFDQILNVATKLIGNQTSLDQAGALNIIQNRTSFRNDGLFVQEEVAIKEFLNLTAGIRFDKSTNNGDHEHYYLFPKANAAWNLTKMGNWNSTVIDDIKLRIAYGEGNGLPTFSSRFTELVGSNIGGRPGSLIDFVVGNSEIEPERQTELEGGVDFSLFDGRVALEATYYNKVIRNLLLQAEPPGSTGFSVEWVNGGKLRNRGFELSLRTIPVSTKNIRWSSNVNFWKNRSKVLSLNVPAFDPGGSFGANYGTFFIEEGQTATQIKGIINEAGEMAKVGDAEPDFQMNFFNELTLFKNLSLRFLLHWKKGGDNVNLSQLLNDAGGTSADFDDIEANGEKAGLNRLSGTLSYVQDASYLRLRELGLYYKLPFQIKHIDGITIGASANNYLTWTKYKGYDPEVSNFGTGFGSGIDVMPYPATKRLQLHLSFNF